MRSRHGRVDPGRRRRSTANSRGGGLTPGDDRTGGRSDGLPGRDLFGAPEAPGRVANRLTLLYAAVSEASPVGISESCVGRTALDLAVACSALPSLAERVFEHTGIATTIANGLRRPAGAEVRIAAYRILHEALVNEVRIPDPELAGTDDPATTST